MAPLLLIRKSAILEAHRLSHRGVETGEYARLPDLLTAAELYINIRRKQENRKYSEIGMRKIARPGFEFVSVSGGAVEAARLLQHAQPEKLTDARSFVVRNQGRYPEISAEAMSIYTNGDGTGY